MKRIFKEIYGRIPLKMEVYSLLRMFWKPKHGIYKHLHFEGDFKVKVDSSASFMIRHYGFQIENEVFWNGIYNGWEKVSLQLWGELCIKASVIMDVGANTGVYSLLAKSISPEISVYAIEPVKRVFERLQYNIALNNYDVRCIEKALSNFDGTAIIFDKDTPHTYSVTVNKDTSTDKKSSVEVEIETQRLDTFIEQQNIPQIDLIKLDVEMHEAEALEGMGVYLHEFQPTLLIEILNEEVAHNVAQLISGIEYEYYNIDENGSIRKVESLTKSDYYNFLICRPEVAEQLHTLNEYLV